MFKRLLFRCFIWVVSAYTFPMFEQFTAMLSVFTVSIAISVTALLPSGTVDAMFVTVGPVGPVPIFVLPAPMIFVQIDGLTVLNPTKKLLPPIAAQRLTGAVIAAYGAAAEFAGFLRMHCFYLFHSMRSSFSLPSSHPSG